MSGYPAITSLIPHRDGMVLLERVLWADQDQLCAEVIIRQQDLFFDAQSSQVGAWLGIEYMAQAIAALDGYRALLQGAPVRIGLLLGTRNYEAACAGFDAGTVMQVWVRQELRHDNGLAAFRCEIRSAQDAESDSAQVLASASVNVFQPDDMQQFLLSIGKEK